MAEVLGYLGLVVGPIGLAVGVIVALSNRQIRQERIDHLDGMVDDLRGDMEDERRRCDSQVADLSARCSRLEGQLEVATGELGDRIGARIAESVFARMFDEEDK